MQELLLKLNDEHALARVAHILQGLITPPAVLYLMGELGTGKTTFARHFIQTEGFQGAVKSPSFTLVLSYPFAECSPHLVKTWPHGVVHHFDFYRLDNPEALNYLGMGDYSGAENIWIIEWPELGGKYTPPPDLTLKLDYAEKGRTLQCIAHNEQSKQWLNELQQHFRPAR